jgi:thymidylate synthase (FAD)
MASLGLYGDDMGDVTLIDYMGNDRRAALAARVSMLNDEDILTCDGSLEEKDARLLKFLLRERHTSPFEHSTLTFRMNVPMFVKNQVMRHRTFSYNEASRRYTSENLEFHIPRELRKQAVKNLQCSLDETVDHQNGLIDSIRKQVDLAYQTYQMLIDCGVAREQARMVLPQNMYCTFWMTGSLHNFIKFLQLRMDEHAQPECRELASAMHTLMCEVYPETMRIAKDLGILK